MATLLQNRRTQHKSLKIADLSPSPLESQFLSPALSTLSVMSPPPRLQADDYFGSKRAKKRRLGGIRRPCPTPLLQSEDSGSGEASAAHNTEPEDPNNHTVESSNDHIDDAGLHTESVRSDLPLLATIAAGGQIGTGLSVEQNGHGLTGSHRPNFTNGTPSNQEDAFDSEDSPAVDSLRRISRSMTQSSDSKRRELKHLSKTLTDKISAVFRSKGNPLFGELNESNVFGFHKASNNPGTFRNSTSGDLSPTSKVSNARAAEFRIPAYITLRKASGANSVAGTTNANNSSSSDNNAIPNNQQATNSTIASNLVSFQSRVKHHAGKSAWQKDPNAAKRSTSPMPSSSYYEKPHIRARFMSLSQLGDSTQSQQYTFLAEPVLTVTSFYPTRATSSRSQSRSNSVAFERAPFRLSIVQIVSRRSVHEVIWYEDETSASDDSSSPISPRNDSQENGGSVPQVVLESGRQETPLIAITTSPTEVSALPQANEHASPDSLIDPTDAHNRLLSWSWDNPRPSTANFSNPSQEGNEVAEIRERTSNVSMRSNLNMRRAATADILTAGYSPHPTGQDSMPVEGDTDDESMAKSRTETKKGQETPEPFDRGLDMFQRRGISRGSVHSARIGSQSIGEKNGVKRAGSQLRVNTK